MSKVKLVQKKVHTGHRDIIRFQIITHCFIENIQFSNNELACLTLLGAYGESELSDFCNSAVEEKIFKTAQTVRNFLTKACKLDVVVKDGTNKKKISLNDALQVQTAGSIILDYKLIHVTQEQ